MDTKEFYEKLDRLYGAGKPEPIEAFLRHTMDLFRPCCGNFNPVYVAATSELASFYRMRGKADYSVRYYQEVLNMLGRFMGEDSHEYAAALTNLASAYRILKDYENAERYYEEAKSVFEVRGETGHYLYSCVLDNMSSLAFSRKEYEKGEALMLQALDIVKKIPGTEAEQAVSYLNLASIANETGDIARASGYLDEAMNYFTSHKEDSHYLNAVNLEAILMAKQGQSQAALEKLYGLRSAIEDMYGQNQYYEAVCTTIKTLEAEHS